MKSPRPLELSLFRGRVARLVLFLLFISWGLRAVPALFAFPSASLASGAQKAFGLKLGDQVTQPADHPDFFWIEPGQNSILDLREAWHATRFPFAIRVFKVDADLDGDLDLVTQTGLSRVLVWINDGRGHYFLVSPGRHNLVKVRPFFRESAEEDYLPLWLGPQRPCLESVSLSSITKEWTVIIPRFEGYSLRSPRAPPFSLITL